ncbi:hypothetical protein [Luteococcus peritonei]|uniref:XRE family transcriptional regulator n=1 Tax=Luteococcus peritonei TaxID=88874 RepID=A0ABW4RSK6_9ACTN
MSPDDTPADGEDFARLLSRAVMRRELTLDSIASRLRAAGCPVSTATLSYWQNGRTIPTRISSMRAVSVLERVLLVPPGHLLSALPQGAPTAWRPSMVIPPDAPLRAVLKQMKISLERFHTPVVHMESLVLDEEDRVQRHLVRQVLRAEVDGRITWPVIYKQEDVGDEAPWVVPLLGCQLVQHTQVAEMGLFVGEMTLPQPVRAGDLASIELEVVWTPALQPCLSRALAAPVQYLVMDVTFQGRVPASARHTHTPSFEEDAQARRTPLEVHDNAVQLVQQHAAPGLHAIEWDWPQA